MIRRIERAKGRIEGDDRMHLRLVIIFFLALLSNSLGCAFTYSMTHKMIHWVTCLGFVLPMVNFTISLLFLEARTLREKLSIMLINSLALSIGGTLVSLYFH
jgi:hypothetical protein